MDSFTGLNITPDTEKVDNVEYDAMKVAEKSKKRRPAPNTCCQKTE